MHSSIHARSRLDESSSFGEAFALRVHLGVVVAAIVLVTAASTIASRGEAVRKDKAALILYGGILDSPIVIDRPDTANMADIALLRIRGPALAPETLAARPCVGLALFTVDEWNAVRARRVKPIDVAPELARVRVRLYPAIGADSAAVLDPLAAAQGSESPGEAWIASGAPYLNGTSIPVTVSPDTRGGCDVKP